MKKIISLLACLLAAPAMAANELTIAAGETYTITPQQQRLTLSSLRIGDGARIIFAIGVNDWYLRADQAYIGRNVVIDGNGQGGAVGVDGKHAAAVSVCKGGAAGFPGGDGINGSHGVSMRIQLGLVAFEGLQILANGGVGGDGGAGGDGSAAGSYEASCGKAETGGAAGEGGNGGNGGNGGDITLMYWPASNQLDMSRIANEVQVSAEAGVSGTGGRPGKPGAGSRGRYVKKKTLTGNMAWAGGSEAGAEANKGKDGIAGKPGDIVVEQALVSVVPAAMAGPAKAPAAKPAPEQSSSNRDDEVRAIKQELRSLLQRLEELETEE